MYLDVRVLASPLRFPRVGIVVPLHRQTAADRNRLKRRLRELTRLTLLPALRDRAAVDMTIRARAEAYAADFEALSSDVRDVRARVTADAAGA